MSIEILEARIAPAAVAAIELCGLDGSNGFKLLTLAAETFGAINAMRLEGVTILASGVNNPAKVGNAIAIKSLTVNGDVRASSILAGYDATGAAVNADVQIGKVLVKGQWIASDLVAGASRGADGIFGTADDALIGGGNAIVSKIASITISGAAFGRHWRCACGGGVASRRAGVPMANDFACFSLRGGSRKKYLLAEVWGGD